MLRYFPASFPDETLYSRLCRYHRLSGYTGDRTSLHQLIGIHTHVIISALPSKLGTLVSRLPAQANVRVEDIASGNTLFPFYAAFLPAQRAASVYAVMRGNSASGIKMSMGLLASRLGGRNNLRFCRTCAQEEYTSTGQPYWHRVHQLPGVLVCPAHQHPLSVLGPEAVQIYRHKLVLPDDENLVFDTVGIELSDVEQEAALRIALLSADVLFGRIQPDGPTGAHQMHRANAHAKGLLRSNGRIYTDELRSLVGLYCSSLPAGVEFGVIRCRLLDWALRLLRKPRGSAIHPLLHIVLLDCLRYIDRKAAPLRAYVDVVLAAAPPVHTRKIIDQADLAEKLSCHGTTLSCVAKAMGISVTTAAVEATRAGLKVSRRPKHITAERVTDVGISLKLGWRIEDVALKHAISIGSVYRILRMDTVLAKAYEGKMFASERDKYRRRYLGSRADKAAYAWLRRHDGQWLAEHLKMCPSIRASKSCVDWHQRDQALARQIATIDAELRGMVGKPTHISQTKLKRLTSMADTIEHNLPSLPLTQAVLEACAESSQAHQRRRIMWAYCELKKSPGYRCRLWEVLRIAGVRRLHPSNVELVYSLI